MNVLPLDIPYQWRAIQLAIECLAPGGKAYIGGGALRDLYLGKKHKDLDIFVQSRRGPGAGGFDKTISTLSRVLGKPTKQLTHVEYLAWSPEVTGFANWNILGEDVQVIGVDYRPFTVRDCLARFDFGICQIAYDGMRVLCTDEFRTDVANKTFTQVRYDDMDDGTRTLDRFQRLHDEKYEGYQFVPYKPEARPSTRVRRHQSLPREDKAT